MTNSETLAIPAGYKQTEVGVVPDDWSVAPLNEICDFGGGTTPPRAQHERYFINGSNNWVKTTDLNNSLIGVSEEQITDLAVSETGLKLHPIGSVLVAMYGGFNQIGRTGYITRPSAINQALVAIKPKPKKLESYYLLSQLNYNVGYWKGVASSSRKDPNITSNDVKNYPLAFPLVKEQTAIANALSDVDKLIAALETLIAKKSAIKTAAMQQLLTGKKRLPAFAGEREGQHQHTPRPGYKHTELGEIPEDWEVVSYENAFKFLTTASNSRSDLTDVDELAYIHYGDIHTLWDIKLDFSKSNLPKIAQDKVGGAAFLQDGDVVMADASEDYAGIGKSIEIQALGRRKAIAGLHTFLLRDKGYFVDGFRGYLHLITSVKSNFDRLATGLKVYGLSKNSLKEVLLPVPPKQEQTAIANVLSDMDTELDALQQRLAKTQAIKQGMMQELLTGKTRLINAC